MTHTRNVRYGLLPLSLLLVPFIAMQFTDEVAWGFGDFIVAGGLLFGSGILYALLSSKIKTRSNRTAVGVAIFTGLVLVWVTLAVGLD